MPVYRYMMRLLLLGLLIITAACGGGGNTVSNDTDGILSIDKIVMPATVGGQGTVKISLAAPKGGPGSGTITVTSGNSNLLAFTTPSQAVTGESVFYFTTKEVAVNTDVSFTVTVGSLTLTKQMTLVGTGALNLDVTVPVNADAPGTITAVFAQGAQAAGRKVAITFDNTANVALDTSEQMVDATGKAVFSYRIVNITKDTTISFTAKSEAQSVVKSVLIPVSMANPPVVINPEVNSIAFVSASPGYISLKGTGGAGRTETSIVSFIVRDISGQPLSGQIIDFTLDTSVGGIKLVPDFATSDNSGVVKTIVNSGVISTPVRVTATVRGKSVSTKSDQLVISTGLPHQDGFSVSAVTLNPEAWNFDGAEVPVTAMLSDHFGNPVPDGTSVNFMAYGGSIESYATTINGVATVKWRSQNPRPNDGIAKILAYAIGEESFIDLNGNGKADDSNLPDPAKPHPREFIDLPEAFLSISGAEILQPNIDTFIDFNGNGSYDSGDGKFNGVLQGADSVNTGTATSIHIFRNYRIIMSGSQALISPDSLQAMLNGYKTVSVTVKDGNGNALPKGTTIKFTSQTGGCTGGGAGVGGFVTMPATITIDGTGTQTSFNVSLKSECTNPAIKGNLTVTVTTPKGIETIKEISVTYP